MKHRKVTPFGVALVATTALSTFGFASLASADPTPWGQGDGHVVFVQTDNVAGNQIVAYDRASNGTLTQAGTYSTGGLGGVLSGSVVDHLASQGSLVLSNDGSTLYAVNAGSNTVSVFAVYGDHLVLRQTISSGGDFPVSIAVHDNLVYVVNALNGGNVQGYYAYDNHLVAIPGSSRLLGLNVAATPQFVNTPGQVAFTPDGNELVVTTKANGSSIDVFRVWENGYLAQAPVVNSEPGAVPFAISFDRAEHLVVAEASGNVATFSLSWNGTATELSSIATSQAATCWIAPAGGYFYVSNAGSNSLTGISIGARSQLTDLGNTATDPGTVDAAASSDQRFLYVQTGATGNVDEFSVGADGSLTSIGSVTVPGAVGAEGIAAS